MARFPVEEHTMQSAFGVEHGDLFSKDDRKPTVGRYATAYELGGFHGAVAGKKGKKLKAAGTEIGSSVAGAVAGTAAGLATKNPRLAQVGSIGGGLGGSLMGTKHAQKKGYYKKQKKGAF